MAAVNFDDLWNYDDPAATEKSFRSLLAASKHAFGPDWDLELQTQIARTLGLQQKFSEAHALLDTVERQLSVTTPLVRVRYFLERGRAFNSDKKLDSARTNFKLAFDLANQEMLDFYTIDAAHMLAIAIPEESQNWNELAIGIADQSTDKRARGWRGSLYNNLGWTHFSAARYDSAMLAFDKALAARREQGKPGPIRIARWCLARCMRATGQFEDALKEQQSLLQEADSAKKPDGFIYEEIAECLTSLKREKEAASYFAKAYALLSQDKWLSRDEPDRIARMKKLGNVK